MRTDGFGDVEVQLGIPAERELRGGDLVDAERLAVRLRAAALAGRVMRDHGAQPDQHRPLLLRDARAEGGVDRLDVLAVVDLERVPALRREARGDVLGEGEVGAAVDRDPVVVVEVDDAPEAEMARDRRRLRRDSLHQVAVGADREDAVIDDLGAVALAEEALGHGHADAVREPLSERARRRLDTGGVPELGMAGRERAQLPEAPDLVERQVVARQVQARVEQHRRVPRREHEAVAIRPRGVAGVVAHDPREEHVRSGRQRERCAGVPRARRLDGVDRERPDGVDAEAVLLRIGLRRQRGSARSAPPSRGARAPRSRPRGRPRRTRSGAPPRPVSAPRAPA
jgi:hypothetical protein